MRFLIDECCDPRLGTALPARLAVLMEELDDKLLGAITVLDDQGRRRRRLSGALDTPEPTNN
ncbi:MAG: hypothetical protein U1E52_11320 [Geminicoccaceae bacterium]